MLTNVYLHGHLADKYGPVFKLDIESVAGAVRLLHANFSSFASDVIGHEYTVMVGKTNIDKEELLNPINGNDIHLVPTVRGSDDVVKTIVGIVLIVVGVIFYEVGGQYLIDVGIALVIQGVAGLIFSAAPLSLALTVNGQRPSYAFNGPVNTTAQGSPVPVLYGRALIGSLAVSGSIRTGAA